jgi:hypothetical protein
MGTYVRPSPHTEGAQSLYELVSVDPRCGCPLVAPVEMTLMARRRLGRSLGKDPSFVDVAHVPGCKFTPAA